MLTASICHVGLAIVSVLAKKSSRSGTPGTLRNTLFPFAEHSLRQCKRL